MNAPAPHSPCRRWLLWAGAAVAAVLCVTVIGPFLFLHVIEGKAPSPLKLPSASKGSGSSSVSTSPTAADGSWTVTSPSKVGYRVQEILFGQSATAVGLSGAVKGTLTVSGSTVEAAGFSVAVDTIVSNESGRNPQFDGRIMDVAAYSTANFSLTSPIKLSPLPTVDSTVSVPATGNLTMHGTTRPVTFTLDARYTGTQIEVSGSIQITFERWNIANPSGGPAQVGNSGTLEFLLYFSK